MSDSDFGVQSSTFDVQSSASTDAARPWLGLASYSEETRQFFFGRDDEVAELGRRVQRKLLTVLFGQSGLGKTSILRAGLVPRLRPEGFCPVYVRLDYSPYAPSASEQIKNTVFRTTKEAGSWSRPGASQQGESLWEFFHHRDDVLTDASGRSLTPLLIFDQFEEIFTLAQTDDSGRARARMFQKELSDLVENRAPVAIEDDESAADRYDFARADYRVLIALREDYLAHLESLRDLMPSITQNRVRLTRMNGGPALEAVIKPGRGLVNDEVARQIIRFVSGARELELAEVEPSLLSLVCRELNERRIATGEPEISADLLAGSRDTILNEFYERSLADQPEGVRRFVEDELLTDSGFRESLAEERAQKACAEAGAPNALSALVDRRLLRIEERLDVRRVELTHDVLCNVVKARRDSRREREAREAAERRAAETEAREMATKKALLRARMIAAGCAVLAVAAIGSAIFGFVSLKEAREANVRAEAARAQAEGLVSYMMDDVGPALNDYGQSELFAKLAERTVAYFDELPPELRSIDSDRRHAEALMGLGDVLDNLGREGESTAAFTRGIDLIADIAARPAATPDDQGLLLMVRAMEGYLLRQPLDRPEEAIATYGRSIEGLEALMEAHPESEKIAQALFRTRMNLGFFLSNYLRRPADGIPEFVAARELVERGIAESKEGEDLRLQLSWVLTALGGAYDQALDHEKGFELTREGLEYSEAALKEDPGNRTLLARSAVAAQQLSYRAANIDRQLSTGMERIARDRFRTLSELDPGNRYYRVNFVWSHMMEGYNLEVQGEYAAAREMFHGFRALLDADPEIVLLREDPERPAELCLDEGRMAAHMGDIDHAREMLAEGRKNFEQAHPDANPDDIEYRKAHIRWQEREIELVGLIQDWPEAEKRSRAVLAEVTAALEKSPDDAELLLRRALGRTYLGQSLLERGQLDAAYNLLSAAVADYEAAPAVPQSVVYYRELEELTARWLLSRVMIGLGRTSEARSVLEDAYRTTKAFFERNPTFGSNRRYMTAVEVTLAETLDPNDDRRNELLDHAEAVLTEPGMEHLNGASERRTLSEIERLRAGK